MISIGRRDVLDIAADELRDIADEAVRERLTDVYKARRSGLSAG